jgi:hypothetical protein
MDVDNTNRQGNHPVPYQQQQRKKCRGNRRNQRFRRKCRAQKIKPVKIEKLLKKRNLTNMKNQRKTSIRNTNNNNIQTTIANQGLSHKNTPVEVATTTNITTIRNLNKRKRNISLQDLKTHSMVVPKSTSSISILQPSLKKKKPLINNITHMKYRLVFTYFHRISVDIKYLLL